MNPALVAEFASDLVGFFSALILTWPAVRDSRLRRVIDALQNTSVRGKGGFDEVRAGARTFLEDELKRLQPRDYAWVVTGLVLLIFAYGIKLASWLLPDK